MKRITVELTDEQYAKLERLATQRGNECKPRPRTVTPEECLIEFVDTCKPGGSGWDVPGS